MTTTRTNRARTLRARMTEAEKALWSKLRSYQLGGRRFRRQEPIGPYFADFVCREASLIVEVDGGHHADSKSDADRTAFLADGGFRTTRFWNNEVLTNVAGVFQRIEDELANTESVLPHPTLPRGTGED